MVKQQASVLVVLPSLGLVKKTIEIVEKYSKVAIRLLFLNRLVRIIVWLRAHVHSLPLPLGCAICIIHVSELAFKLKHFDILYLDGRG